MSEAMRLRHTVEVRDESGLLYATVITSDAAVARLSIVRAVEEWFDTMIAPAWSDGRAQLEHLPQVNARVR